ncbi:hypothetical protein M9H77_08186 [Catharanthus roseus]|uniref:Uncharacterized protein n=1 Tax=Catharanthus roseus TaxID=4058 RepID=A0ACC0BX27_CATRO|nr:hypothetical protein M9H77_08186 [Catharanthus roseus]
MHSRALQTRFGSQTEVIRMKFRHLVVNTSQTPFERSITKQPHSHIIGQNRLQNLGAPTRSTLGPTSVSSPMMRCPRRPIGPHPLRSTPSSSGSTLPSLKCLRHRKMPSYRGLTTYSAIL